jgi:hypothetical protein
MELNEKIYRAGVLEKISIAKFLYEDISPDLLKNTFMTRQINIVKDCNLRMITFMKSLGLVKICKDCAKDNHSKCCFSDMSEEADSILLMMNMLLNGEVKMNFGSGLDCCFLGANGCSLIMKPFFCLAYNCRKVIVKNSQKKIMELSSYLDELQCEQDKIEQWVLSNLISDPIGIAKGETISQSALLNPLIMSWSRPG